MARTAELPNDVPLTITERAALQHGVVSLRNITDAGLNTEQRRWQVSSGRIERVAPRVYRVVGSPDTHRQRLTIGILSLGAKSWVSYEAAATLHGLDRSRDDAVEFTIERGRRPPVLSWPVHTTRFVSRLDTVEIDGLPVMSATRTVLDLAHSRAPRRRVEAAFDSAVRKGLSHPEVLAARLSTLRGSGRWGVTMIDRILPDAGGHSPLERAFLRIVRECGFSRPATQAIQRSPTGRHIARVDFLFDELALVVEVTGRLGHVSDAERARDAQRRNELQDLGFTVIEYTSTQIWQHAESIRRDLRRRLGPR